MNNTNIVEKAHEAITEIMDLTEECVTEYHDSIEECFPAFSSKRITIGNHSYLLRMNVELKKIA